MGICCVGVNAPGTSRLDELCMCLANVLTQCFFKLWSTSQQLRVVNHRKIYVYMSRFIHKKKEAGVHVNLLNLDLSNVPKQFLKVSHVQ